ncbi:hypothetical protein SLE2022_370180 [Rubroshorea leprosula]
MNLALLFCIIFCTCISICLSDSGNLQDTCPTGSQTAFINGLLCKNPSDVSASDFRSSKLREAGEIDIITRSAVSIATAKDFPGLNTLGLSVARTDLELDGIVVPHSHPRATEMFFVYKGAVVAGFIDTNKNLFKKILREGDVIVFPRGLLHFCFNIGFEFATAYSFFNGQNPGVVSITDAIVSSDPDIMSKIKKRLISASESEVSHN